MTTQEDLTGSTRAKGLRAGITNIKANAANAAEAGKVLTRLAPKQIKDEIAIAKIEVKEKGIALGKGAAVAAAAIIFALFMAISLVILAYVGLAAIMPNWAAALILVLLFLILAAILGFAGYKMVMKQLPFKPESAIFGLLYDLGVLKEGSAMTSKRLKREQAEKAEAKKAQKDADKKQNDSDEAEKAPAAPAPNKEQLVQRTKQRREHLKTLRDDIESYASDVQTRTKGLKQEAMYSVRQMPTTAANSGKKLIDNASNTETLQARWKSFAALAAALGAFAVFLGKLIGRK